MAVAKRQREKPIKIEQKGPRTRMRTLGEAHSLLASPVYLGQARGRRKKNHKKWNQN